MLKRKMSEYFTKRKYVLLIVFTALCAGMIAGTFGVISNETAVEYGVNQMAPKDIIMASFLENIKFLGWLFLWGMNLFGAPVIVYLLYVKGGALSAAICSLGAVDDSSGIMLVLSAVPYVACTIASIMILSQGSINCSLCLMKNVWEKRKSKAIYEELLVLMAEFVPAMLLALLGGMCETIFKANIA